MRYKCKVRGSVCQWGGCTTLCFFVKRYCLASAKTYSSSWFRIFILSEKAHFFLLLYTVNTWDEHTFHGIAPYHIWCPSTKFLTDWYLSASEILTLNYNSFFKTQILKPAGTLLIWGKRSIMKTAFFFFFFFF